MNRSTKLIVIASNLSAIWLAAALVSRGIPPILIPAVTIFLLSVGASVVFGDRTVTFLLMSVYVFPAACFAWFGHFFFSYYAIWLAGISGAMLPRALGQEWKYPHQFAAPLMFWALAIALSWPITVLREVDFVPAMLSRAGVPASLPQLPGVTAVWVASVASISLTGFLLLDWMFTAYPPDRMHDFEAGVIWPLFGAGVLTAAVGAYQAVVDPEFLNQTFFRSLGRTVGTMRDANPFGVIVAMWVPFAAAGIVDRPHPWWRPIARYGVLAVLVVAVWSSGSRTALLAALSGLAMTGFHARRTLAPRWLLAGLAATIVATVVIMSTVPSTTWTRARAMVPSLSKQHVLSAAQELWDRGPYGRPALMMIEEYPIAGVGVGGFQYMHGSFIYRTSRTMPPPDNAQNWFRQQLAELGVLGSLGWIAWTAAFGWMLVRRRDIDGDRRVMAGAAKGAVLGVTAASLLGVPTQDTAAAITFVVFACWCVMLKGLGPQIGDRASGRLRSAEWAAVGLALAGFLAATVYDARTELRPPVRALRDDLPYRYGFVPDDLNPAMQWAGAKAVDVFHSQKRWFKLELGEVAPDAANNPVEVKVWINKTQLLRVSRRGNFPVTRWIRMPREGTPVMIQIESSRTWRATADGRERGVAIREWSFADDDPPKGSITIESPDAYTL